MIRPLPYWILNGHRPSFYDTESVTLIELAGSLHGKMNEVVDEFNTTTEANNKAIADFMAEARNEFEAFETAMRQEFQDFIDTVDIKIESITALDEAQVEAVLNGEY